MLKVLGDRVFRSIVGKVTYLDPVDEPITMGYLLPGECIYDAIVSNPVAWTFDSAVSGADPYLFVGGKQTVLNSVFNTNPPTTKSVFWPIDLVANVDVTTPGAPYDNPSASIPFSATTTISQGPANIPSLINPGPGPIELIALLDDGSNGVQGGILSGEVRILLLVVKMP